ncbi:M protein [Helicobacter pylori]|nr:M protein [Helicobacter pylori]
MNALKNSQQALENEKAELLKEKEKLTKEKTELTDKNKELDAQVSLLKGQIKSLEQSQQALENEKAELLKEKNNLTQANTDLTEKNQKLTTENTALTDKNKTLTTDKENLNTDLSNAKNQVIQAKEEKDKLEQKCTPYKKLERLYEVFLEVKGCLNFKFVPQTHSAMDLIASVLSDSKYYLENLYNKASQELSDKRSDKGEKLAKLFDLLFEYVKDNKFERLKEPSAYDSTCKRLYPEQNTSQKMQRVVLIGYTYDKKTTYCTIVDMGS